MNKILPSIAMTPSTPAVYSPATIAANRANAALTGAGDAGASAAVKPVGRNSAAAPDFTSLLGNMLNEVSAAQGRSSDMNRRLQMGDPKATIEETVLAMNTASVQFQMVVQVRNKLVQSYTDIMNMPV